jgi:hypothetical protein
MRQALVDLVTIQKGEVTVIHPSRSLCRSEYATVRTYALTDSPARKLIRRNARRYIALSNLDAATHQTTYQSNPSLQLFCPLSRSFQVVKWFSYSC